MSKPIDEQIEDFEGDAVARLEDFITSMKEDDRRFCIPVAEYDGSVEDHWTFVYSDRAFRLIDRFIDRLYKLARLKFGEEAAFSTWILQPLCIKNLKPPHRSIMEGKDEKQRRSICIINWTLKICRSIGIRPSANRWMRSRPCCNT